MEDWTPEQLRQRVEVLESVLKERNKEVEILIREVRVQESIAKNAESIDRENLQLKRQVKEQKEKIATLEDDNRTLRLELGQKEHKDTMSRYQAMLSDDNYTEAGPVAAWQRTQGGGGANPSSVGRSGAAPTGTQPPATNLQPSAKGLMAPVTINSSSISSIGFSHKPPGTGEAVGGSGAKRRIDTHMTAQQSLLQPRVSGPETAVGAGAPPPPPMHTGSMGMGMTPPSSAGMNERDEFLAALHEAKQLQDTEMHDDEDTEEHDDSAEIHFGGGAVNAGGIGALRLQSGGAMIQECYSSGVDVSPEEVEEAMQMALDDARVEEIEDRELESRFKRLMEYKSTLPSSSPTADDGKGARGDGKSGIGNESAGGGGSAGGSDEDPTS